MEYLGESKPINQVHPLVSVCVPAFHHADFIAQCLDSILAQETDFLFEILVGEDDSTDGTREICLEYADKYPDKIRLFLRKAEEKMLRNGKKVGRGNHLSLYQSARGKYICICDGDDYWLSPQKLQHQMDLMERNPQAAICVTQTHIENGNPPLDPNWTSELKVISSDKLTLTYYLGHVSSWMIRNCMADFVKNEAAIHSPGLDLILFNFYKKHGDVIQSPMLTSFYRLNPNGSLRKMKPIQVQKKIFRMNWYLFRFVHQDPILFFRSLVYFSKRFLLYFIFSKTAIKN
jgi:glycosyltransferase involved in cell wall biosynthesis